MFFFFPPNADPVWSASFDQSQSLFGADTTAPETTTPADVSSGRSLSATDLSTHVDSFRISGPAAGKQFRPKQSRRHPAASNVGYAEA